MQIATIPAAGKTAKEKIRNLRDNEWTLANLRYTLEEEIETLYDRTRDNLKALGVLIDSLRDMEQEEKIPPTFKHVQDYAGLVLKSHREQPSHAEISSGRTRPESCLCSIGPRKPERPSGTE